MYDYKPADAAQKPGKTAIPGFMASVFEDTLRLQKKAAEEAHEAMAALEKRIDGLEKRVLGRNEM